MPCKYQEFEDGKYWCTSIKIRASKHPTKNPCRSDDPQYEECYEEAD